MLRLFPLCTQQILPAKLGPFPVRTPHTLPAIYRPLQLDTPQTLRALFGALPSTYTSRCTIYVEPLPGSYVGTDGRTDERSDR